MTTPTTEISSTERGVVDAILARPGVTRVEVEDHPQEVQRYLVRVYRAGELPELEFHGHDSLVKLLVSVLAQFKRNPI